MATKATGCSCYDKAAPDEPIFVLRAKDVLAPSVVRDWAYKALLAGTPLAKVKEALECSMAMGDWAFKNGGAKAPD